MAKCSDGVSGVMILPVLSKTGEVVGLWWLEWWTGWVVLGSDWELGKFGSNMAAPILCGDGYKVMEVWFRSRPLQLSESLL